MIANIVSNIGTPKIIIGTIKLNSVTLLYNPSNDITEIQYPKNSAPVSPMKILLDGSCRIKSNCTC